MEKNYFAVDIGGTATKYALVSPDFTILEKGEFPTPYEGTEALLDAIAGAVRPYADQLRGVGVSVPGVVQSDGDYTIKNGGMLYYLDGVPFGRLLREKLGLPCAVENDGKSAALGEYAAGALRNVRCGVVIVLGTGVGGGIVLDGKVLKGSHLFAGEFSYLYSNPAALPKWNAYFGYSSGALGLKARALAARGLPEDTELTGYEIFDAANRGDELMLQCVRVTAREVAMQICNLQAILDPELFVIGGGVSRQPLLISMIREETEGLIASLPPIMHAPVPRVVTGMGGNDANLIGAVYNCGMA